MALGSGAAALLRTAAVHGALLAAGAAVALGTHAVAGRDALTLLVTLAWPAVGLVNLVVRERRARERRRSREEGVDPLLEAHWSLPPRGHRRALAAAFGATTVWVAVLVGSPVVPVLVAATTIAIVLSARLLGPRVRRRRLVAAVAAHPDAGVVVVAFADTGSTAWAQWARRAGGEAPTHPGHPSVLVGDAHGIEHRPLDRSGRLGEARHAGAATPARWAWEDLELSQRHDPASAAADVLVVMVLGQQPGGRARAVPARRRRFDIALTVLDGAPEPSSPAAVGAAIVTLGSRRPSTMSGPGAGDAAGVR